MGRAKGRRDRTSPCIRYCFAAATILGLAVAAAGASSNLPEVCVSISAFVSPRHLAGRPQQQQQQQLYLVPQRDGKPPSSFISGKSASTHAELESTFTTGVSIRLLLPLQRQHHQQHWGTSSALTGDGGSANSENFNSTNTTMSSAVFAQAHQQQQQQKQQRQLLAELPQSPRERQKMYASTLMGFVKAGDVKSALLLYDKAAEVGCMISPNLFNAILSVCEGDKAS